VASLVEAQTVKLQQNTGEAADNNEVELSFSRQMEHLLNHHLVSECMHRTAPMLEDVAGASTIGSGATLASVAVGGTSARAGTPSTAAEANSSGLARRQGVSKRGVAVHQAVATEAALATTTSAGHLGSEAAARRVEAAAYRQLHDERPIGVWIEVKWVRPHREPSWARAAGDTHPNTTADVTGTSPHAVLEILLLQLHDSEYTDYVPRSEGVGRLLPNSPLDLAIAAVGRSLSVWAPSREALEAPFKLHEDEDEGERLNKRQQRSLLSGVMSRHAMKSVLRITSMSIVGEQLLDGARGALKDFFVRTTLVVKDENAVGWTETSGGEQPNVLKVEPSITAKTSTRPKPSLLEWGAEAIALELPGPVELPVLLQVLVRAKDSVGSGVVLGHALIVLDNLNGQASVNLLEATALSEPAPSPPPSPPSSRPPPMSHNHQILSWQRPCLFRPIGASHRTSTALPPSPPPSPPSVERPNTAPGFRSTIEAPKGNAEAEIGSDRPATAGPGAGIGVCGGNSGGSQTALPPLSQHQASQLLREEILQAEEQLATGGNLARILGGGFKSTEGDNGNEIVLRFNYSISVPYASLRTDLICARDARSMESVLHPNSDRRATDVDAESGRVKHGHGSVMALAPSLAPPDGVSIAEEVCRAASASATFGPDCQEIRHESSSKVGCYNAIPSVKGLLGSFCKAALFDGPECVRELLSARADANARDLVSSTPLHKAVANGDTRALRLLLGAGADINAMNIYGDTCVHRAVENVRLATLVELLRFGADMDQPNKLGDTPLHLACATGNAALVRALLSAGAVVLSYNMRGHVPLHTAIQSGQRTALEVMILYHSQRRLPWQTLLAQKSNDTPLHVAVRAMRISDMVWMVENGGFASGLVLKNNENRDPMKLLKEAKKLLGKMVKYRKKAMKAMKTGKEPPPKPPQIALPPQNIPLPDGDPRVRMARQPPGSTQAYWLRDPCYVKWHTTPLPPPDSTGKKAKKAKGSAKKGKKEKVAPPPAFALTLDEATARLDGKGGGFIDECAKLMQKKYDEEKKAAEKAAAEKAKAKEAKAKEAKAKEAKKK